MAGRLKGNMIVALAGLSCCAIANADLLFHRLATVVAVVTLSLCFSSSFFPFYSSFSPFSCFYSLLSLFLFSSFCYFSGDTYHKKMNGGGDP